MDMVDKQLDHGAFFRFCTLLATFLHELMIKIDKERDLILNRGEKVVLTNEIEDIRPTKPNKVRKSFARLAIHGISAELLASCGSTLRNAAYNSAKHSMRMAVSGEVEVIADDEGARSSSA